MIVSSGRTRTPRKSPESGRKTQYDRKAPALRYLDRHECPDDRPRDPNRVTAYVFDAGRSVAFTGETVGNSAHGGGPTTHARVTRKYGRVSTLNDHVTSDEAKWTTTDFPVTNPRKGERTPEYHAARNRLRAMTPPETVSIYAY